MKGTGRNCLKFRGWRPIFGKVLLGIRIVKWRFNGANLFKKNVSVREAELLIDELLANKLLIQI